MMAGSTVRIFSITKSYALHQVCPNSLFLSTDAHMNARLYCEARNLKIQNQNSPFVSFTTMQCPNNGKLTKPFHSNDSMVWGNGSRLYLSKLRCSYFSTMSGSHNYQISIGGFPHAMLNMPNKEHNYVLNSKRINNYKVWSVFATSRPTCSSISSNGLLRSNVSTNQHGRANKLLGFTNFSENVFVRANLSINVLPCVNLFTNLAGHANVSSNKHACAKRSTNLPGCANLSSNGWLACTHFSTNQPGRGNVLSIRLVCRNFSTNLPGRANVLCNQPVCVIYSASRNSCVNYSTDRSESVEKRLKKLMDMWEVEKAVRLVNDSVSEGIIPHQNIVLNLLQQLAHLGEYESLLELHTFLLDHKLCTDAAFFQCLQEAYHNSGRVDEGVLVLRLIYHRTRRYQDVDVFFTLLTVMVLRHFPDRLALIKEFVQDLKDAKKPQLLPEAGLWKCLMLTERFDEAEELLENSEEIRPLIPQMVADICSRKNQVDCDYNVVLPKLLDVPNLKQKLRVLVLESYAHSLCQSGKLDECLQVLTMARSQGIPLHPDKIRHLLREISKQSPSEHVQSLMQELTTWLDTRE
ncbi:uncharacterized protein LOC121388991 [Gigantopelta aegis]|uniref:uncharacterized protein LOC121388991 n=1 Tax=Gigantopelta aegis TaxID=1735272 RepID=UPI001B88D5CC|nr:uncharacterized protein LOC121388991 [Gigantopelta aegis]